MRSRVSERWRELEMKADRTISSNHCVLATPVYGHLRTVSQWPSAPDPAR